MRMYARNHVMFAVGLMIVSTLFFIAHFNSFLQQAKPQGKPPGWRMREETEADEAPRSNPPSTRPTALTVVVLTSDRPKSLERLLVSLTSATYSPGERIDLIVRQDMPSSGVLCAETSRLLHRLRWPHGTLEHVQETEPRGRLQMWQRSYTPLSSTDYFLILEDDIEVSRFYLRWILVALPHFRSDATIFGISLARPTERGIDYLGLGDVSSSVPVTANAVKYKMATLQALAPIPKHWKAFRRWMARTTEEDAQFDPTAVDDFEIQDLTVFQRFQALKKNGLQHLQWDAYLARYMIDSGLFMLHPWPSGGGALARCWNEIGLVTPRRPPLVDLLDAWQPHLLRWRQRTVIRLDFTGRVM